MAALEVASADSTHAQWQAGLPRLGNDRVVLRELERTDAPALAGLMCDPDIARQTWPPPAGVEAFEQFIEWTWRERAEGRRVSFAIVPRGAVAAAGLFELRKLQPQFFGAELGFALDHVWRGTGLFSTASRLLIDFAFNVLHVHRIEARVSVDNARSNAALERLGARREGVLRDAFARNGEFFDQYLWAIVAGLDEGSPSGVGNDCRCAMPTTAS